MTAPVIYSVSDVSDEQADTLRQKFLKAVQRDDVKDRVHPADVLRARTDPLWCKRYMAHGDLDMDKAFNFMMDSVKFRHAMGVNDMTQDSVLPEFFGRGSLTIHGRDRDGAKVMIFDASLHERTYGERFERVKQFLVYWIEKMEREEHGKRISIILDMGNAGLSSVDLPFIQVLINMFKLYYPDMLNYIIVFEMPWIMNAAWKIIKQMLPPKSHQIIKFASKKDIATLIRPEDCLERWGGENTWTFQYRREECEMPPSPFLGPRNNQVDKPDDDGASQSSDGSGTSRPLSGQGNLLHYHSLLDIPSAAGDKAKVTPGTSASQVSDDSGASSEDLSDQSQEGADDTAVEIGGLLKISPGDEIQFASDAVEARRPLMLRNIRRGPVAFKVKTTAPEKFRVRPSCGVVAPGRRVSVELRLAPGVAAHQALAEKFLLVAAPIQQQQVVADDMASVWRLPCVSASSRV
ncbi:motile sperm domain-containing protein 2-like [Pollicipes pollicipes]|uniref:motile sperm domain-containing protein 2-like n=1 Tax=Pollicipes pollicipes TaxID=41117 RepID=UPI0018857228|nr:motile sperm domain-containing protein 2-like [Pollicipes pollicipes]